MTYHVTREDRLAIALIPTEQLVAVVSSQLVPEIIEVMLDELNDRYVAHVDAAYEDSHDEFQAALDDLLREIESLDVTIVDADEDLEEFEDVDFDDYAGEDFGPGV